MRDDQIRRYARHILLPDVGGIGQAALLAATARLLDDDPASRITATYLAAGGVGTIVMPAADPALAACNPDAHVVADGDGDVVAVPGRPAWWPVAAGDATALAYWCGGIAATQWMHAVVQR